jgi:MFS transporter, ACS family, tartrate transporter
MLPARSRTEVTLSKETDTGALTIEPRTILKVRIRIIPCIFLLYIVAFLDRINIGFAALTMNKELAITSRQFGLLTGIFFIGYFFFEIPSNLLLHKIGARIWIARILISWGIVAILTGFVQNVFQLYAARFLLGLAEAGYFPGIVLYLTYWFPQREQARAIALFMTAIPVASILGAPVSGLILDHVHWLGMGSWRWLLILEGTPAVVGGFLTYFLLPSRPAEATFLTKDEKDGITTAIAQEEEQKRRKHQISAIQALANGRVWHLACIGFLLNIGMYAQSFWVPQLVKSVSGGYSNSIVGLLVMIPYLVGLVGMILVSRSSDRRLERKYHAAIPAIAAGIAFVALSAGHSVFLSMGLLSFVVLGLYSLLGPLWSLPSEFLTGFSAASGIALITSVGILGGFVGPYAVGLIRQRTGSLYGGLAFAGVSVLVSATLVLLLPTRRARNNLAEFR